MSNKIDFNLKFADIKEFEADVLVLKYAQASLGVDELISLDLNKNGVDLKKLRPYIGDNVLVENVGTTNYKKILFIGVNDINDFGYVEIKRFATYALSVLKVKAPQTESIAMTMHGVGYGLDENEALLSQLAGLFKAIRNVDFPYKLRQVNIVDNNYKRVSRLKPVLNSYLIKQSVINKDVSESTYTIDLDKLKPVIAKNNTTDIIDTNETSGEKKHIFVAMPFRKDMYDIFYYGIQKPVHDNGFLCERIDQETFVGDILNKLKKMIETASAVIADLTTQNPNVYLEVGYAWGIGKPTILLIKNGDELKFDVQGQRCIKYDSISELEILLIKEIKGLVKAGEIKYK